MKNIFIGYDKRETIAYHVCSNSIIRTSTNPIALIPLSLPLIKSYNETHNDGSNDFTYTRFLVPYLQNFNGWALFIDGDMILLDDITLLWEFIDNSKAVIVVKHHYKTQSSIKYLGTKNEDYPRKNWSSVILWNCSHHKNKILTPEFVQESSGTFLHRFSWLSENDIGELPVEWNWLPDEFGENNNAKLLHYTLGTPCFETHKNSPMSDKWNEEFKNTTFYYKDI